MIPGLHVDSRPGGETVTSTRIVSMMSSCNVQFYVDGMHLLKATLRDINGFVNGNEIVGVEVYRPPFVPVEFMAGLDICPVVVIWTKMRIHD
jgi:hypothetical protein